MEKKNLEEKWNEQTAALFKKFVTEEIGWDETSRPKCFGTGDAQPYCPMCPYKNLC